ncbi:PrgI family protein [Streptantibioticus ferralitis]|uniref:PrgI family protein n=1 Tax=Streptantibioticus ferralitis TaxID=236510 RepID=A0ABT5Z1Q8_9ACTN|nr:PrgI family protein [Streptantibioticus ferralitis]MDF2257698.1 PrgI family protein [Streptantibioticus ferralitis]
MTRDRTENDEVSYSTRIPADIGCPDRILGPLTARQSAILTGTAGALWLGYVATRPFLAPLVYVALVAPIAAVMTAVSLGRRDGIGMDRFALAALAYRRSPKRRLHAPEGVPGLPDVVPQELAARVGPTPAVLRMPCQQVLDSGVVDLGRDGYAAVASCSTVNFDLRTGAEQQALTGAFARWLNSLTGPAQILIRAHRLNIHPLVDQLAQTAPALPHPALEHAALAHATFLHDLAAHSDLLTRQALLVVREPDPATSRASAAAARVRHRITEATRALAAAEITTTALDPGQTAAAITEATSPETTEHITAGQAQGEGRVWPSMR